MNSLGFHCHALDYLEEVILGNGLRRGEFYNFPPQDIPALKEKIRQYKLITSVHAPLVKPEWYPNPPTWSFLCYQDEEKRQLSLRMIQETMELAQDLGAEYVVVHFPAPSEEENSDPDRLFEIAWDTARRLSGLAQRYQLPIHMEGFSRSLFLTPEFLIQVITQLPGLLYCFDTGHMHIAAQQDGFDLYQFAEEIAPYVGSVHLWNNRGLKDYQVFRHIPVHPSQDPEEGWADIERILREITSRNSSCPIIFESGYIYPPMLGRWDYRDGVRWVKGILAGLF
jgi:sugar phosphate isomerase/epimerase